MEDHGEDRRPINHTNVTGSGTITVRGNHDTISGGAGSDTITVHGNHDTIDGAGGNDSISVFGPHDLVLGGSGQSTIALSGNHDTVTGGTGAADTITLKGNHMTFLDNPGVYNDTVVGFDSAIRHDTIHLVTDTVSNALAHSTSSGGNTTINLSDGSKIVLQGVTHIDSSFFS